MKLNEVPLLSPRTPDAPMQQLQQSMVPLLRNTAIKVNQLSSGRFAARDETATAIPTSGSWAQGDEVINSNRTELGTAGAKYILMGWVCIAAGSPGTWREMRVLTGN